MDLILHAERKTKNVFKVLIAAEYAGVEVLMFDDFRIGVSNKSPEFLKMNPLGHYPVLETPYGPVFQSNAIARFVARDTFLFGTSAIEYGQIEQWIEFSSSTLDASFKRLLLTRNKRRPYNKFAEELLINDVKTGLDTLNKHLASHAFLVGESVTLADIITTCNLILGFQRLMPKSFTTHYQNVETYFWKMMNEKIFRKVIGVVKQLKAPVAFPFTKEPEVAEKVGAAKEVVPVEGLGTTEEVLTVDEMGALEPLAKKPPH